MTQAAVVTGGSSGIGLAICRAFLDADYTVVNLSRRAAPIESPKLTSIEVDLIDAEATRRVAQDVAKRFRATTVIHNAGAIREKPVEQATLEDLAALTQLHIGTALSLV